MNVSGLEEGFEPAEQSILERSKALEDAELAKENESLLVEIENAMEMDQDKISEGKYDKTV